MGEVHLLFQISSYTISQGCKFFVMKPFTITEFKVIIGKGRRIKMVTTKKENPPCAHRVHMADSFFNKDLSVHYLENHQYHFLQDNH